ncbi:MAG: tRNA uridine-5-carboxymethylaminomethyl(34) synthesis enzyme MnmG [Endomicrobiales bacterium]|nr:tRNA uridine-5-carboxymethylaminomethyl(34) synthesis enzyme MnmG [Endomicrobiales bacterium]
MNKYQIVVVGAGHAGCEAAFATSRMGLKTLLVTMHLDAIAQMSCNPAIGGLAKGQIVREIDALGGEMAKITDKAGLQFRMLNLSKGPAVWSPRAQCDKKMYHLIMKQALEKQKHLDLLQAEVTKILTKNGKITGIQTKVGTKIHSDVVILTTGTFLRGLIHVGLTHFPGGRFGELPADSLSGSLEELGLKIKRLKTGTPPRINKQSIDFSKLIIQDGDNPPIPFSHFTDKKKFREKKQLSCWLTHTNEKTHDIIRKNLDRSPLYAGVIKSIGPRYCPSIEDKVVKFSNKTRHQVFLEPEGYDTNEYYANGIPSSLPEDVQEGIVHSIQGLENAQIMRYGYAIEYDFCPPTQLKPTLETKNIENLFHAGQINGTTGYEEAAGQGLVAGINAALKLKNEDPFILGRNEAYIGVLIDELVTKGTDEPYRMFTSRAEYRLLLRSDNADLRLMDYGYKFGLIQPDIYRKFQLYRDILNDKLSGKKIKPSRAKEMAPWDMDTVNFEAGVENKYAGYIVRQKIQVEKTKNMDEKRIPSGIDYDNLSGLLKETQQKLKAILPVTIGQASRIPGVTPADIAILLVHMRKMQKNKHIPPPRYNNRENKKSDKLYLRK